MKRVITILNEIMDSKIKLITATGNDVSFLNDHIYRLNMQAAKDLRTLVNEHIKHGSTPKV